MKFMDKKLISDRRRSRNSGKRGKRFLVPVVVDVMRDRTSLGGFAHDSRETAKRAINTHDREKARKETDLLYGGDGREGFTRRTCENHVGRLPRRDRDGSLLGYLTAILRPADAELILVRATRRQFG